MPRGGMRPNAGRKGLSEAEKREAATLLARKIEKHYPERERRAFARVVRARTPADDELFYDELSAKYADIAPLTRKQLARMKPQERSAHAEARRTHLADHRRRPGSTGIGAFFEDLKLQRLLRVPPPSKAELGAFHQEFADVLGNRLGRKISRRQIAEACREVATLDRRLAENAGRVTIEQRLSNAMTDAEFKELFPDED